MIPKIIHYTWFSNDEMPPKIKECIDSWKKNLPGYELRLWDMESLKEINSVFMNEALEMKKWAYAADYVRLYAVYNYGGIYLDTDVFVYKSFDRFLTDRCFIGKESSIHFGKIGTYQGLSSHCFGAEKGHPFIKMCLDYYQDRHFITSENTKLPADLRMNIVTQPFIQALIANTLGYNWSPALKKCQILNDGLVIYPQYYFDPLQGRTVNRSKSYCLHLAVGGWREQYSVKESKVSFCKRMFFRFFDMFLNKLGYCLKKIN